MYENEKIRENDVEMVTGLGKGYGCSSVVFNVKTSSEV